MSQTLYQLLLEHEKTVADRVYLRQPRHGVWQEYTWAQTLLEARKVAAYIQNLGLERGSAVSIISKNCAEWFIADFGIHLAGMVSVPLFANQREESIHFVLKHANVQLVFIGKLDDHKLVRSYIPSSYKTVGFDYHKDLTVDTTWEELSNLAPLMDTTEPGPDDLFTIIYSSGTTGSPKGAMYTNASIARYLDVFPKDLLRVQQLDYYKLVSYLPLAHVYERSAIQLGSLTINCDISFIESLDKFADNLQEIQPTFFTAVPRIWGVFQQKIEQKIAPRTLKILLAIPLVSQLIKKKIIHGLGLSQCTHVFSGASHLPVSIIKFFDALGIYIQEGYGQTENMAYATLSLLKERKKGFVGTARKGVQLKLSEEGELLVLAPCLMSGYFDNEEATQNSFSEDGWLRTGDLAELDEENRVKILGRISENFKNQSGEYISPSPIEKKFQLKGIVEQMCLVGRELPHNVLLVSLNERAALRNKEEVKKLLQDSLRKINGKLARYEKISNIIVVKEVWSTQNDMLTPTLKVKRKSVERHYSELVQRALVEKQMVIWE